MLVPKSCGFFGGSWCSIFLDLEKNYKMESVPKNKKLFKGIQTVAINPFLNVIKFYNFLNKILGSVY